MPASSPLPRRRSPLASRLKALGAVFAPFGDDSAIAETLHHKISGHKTSDLVLCDLSPLTRIGVKGEGTSSLLKRVNLPLPKEVNGSLVLKDGALSVRLATTEVLLLSALDSDGKNVKNRDFANLRKTHEDSQSRKANKASQRAFLVPYQDSLCWLALAGERASDLLATMCAVDFSDAAFARGLLAQTSLARLSALILRDPAPTNRHRPLFHLLADSASALYLWDCLCDALPAHDGVVCGRQDLLRFLRKSPPKKPAPSRKRRPLL